mmetsp:Transcript_16529/g.50655  ORF Transcript_16529/g.50655 Transcript_16529/m.50655 type:complete len:207 (+) Transcript_16529:141-761(+)
MGPWISVRVVRHNAIPMPNLHVSCGRPQVSCACAPSSEARKAGIPCGAAACGPPHVAAAAPGFTSTGPAPIGPAPTSLAPPRPAPPGPINPTPVTAGPAPNTAAPSGAEAGGTAPARTSKGPTGIVPAPAGLGAPAHAGAGGAAGSTLRRFGPSLSTPSPPGVTMLTTSLGAAAAAAACCVCMGMPSLLMPRPWMTGGTTPPCGMG